VRSEVSEKHLAGYTEETKVVTQQGQESYFGNRYC